MKNKAPAQIYQGPLRARLEVEQVGEEVRKIDLNVLGLIA